MTGGSAPGLLRANARGLGILAAAALVAVICSTSPPSRAAAGPTGTAAPSTIAASGELVHVTWAGMLPLSPVYIDQCNNVEATSPQSFRYGVDCSSLLEQKVDGQAYNANGNGATGVNAANGGVNPDFTVFIGAEPSTDLGWGCSADGAPDGVMIGGVKMYNPCLIRIADYAPAAPRNQAFVPLEIGKPGSSSTAPISLSPSPVTFPDVVVGQASAPQTVTAHLVGGGSPTIAAVDIGGGPGAEYYHLDASGCSGRTLSPANPTCSVSLTFDALRSLPPAQASATLAWFDSSPTDPPLLLNASGRAVGPPAPGSGTGGSGSGSPGQAGAGPVTTPTGTGGSPAKKTTPPSGSGETGSASQRAAAGGSGSSGASGRLAVGAAIVILAAVGITLVVVGRRRRATAGGS